MKNNNHLSITEDMVEKATGSLKWSALIEVVSRTAQPLIFIVLARLLAPSDFGVLAMAMIVISFAQMFWDAGLSKALVQTKQSPEESAHIVFWTNLVLGVLIYIFLFIAAPSIALFFNAPLSEPVLRILGIQVIIASLSSVQQALFIRDLAFRHLFWIKLLTAFIPGLLSIPLAFFGFGVWALVAGVLSGQMLNLLMLWRTSPWRPKFIFDRALAGLLFGFGFWVFLESFCTWLLIWGDSLIIGHFLGVHDLGIYRTGWMLVTLLFGLALNPFLPVLYPTLSRMQDDLPALKEVFLKSNRIVMALALPMGVGLFLIGHELAEVLFGEKWQGVGLVFSIIGMQQGLSWIVSINTEVYRAIGRPDINTKMLFIVALFYFPAYIISAQFGLNVFIYTRLFITIPGIIIQIYLCMYMLKISPFYLWNEGRKIIQATLFMGIVISLLNHYPASVFPDYPPAIKLLVFIITGIISFVAALWLLDRPFILQVKKLFIQAIKA